MADSKKCFKCGRMLALEEFYKHPAMKDGRLGKCKECAKADIKANRLLRVDYYRRADILRARTESRLKLSREYSRKYRKKNPTYAKEWIKRNPEKRKAHTIVSNALRDKRLFKSPCRDCGEVKSEAHHDDYSKPLDVIWLCRKCHAKLHRIYNF